jgi:hypothetical protein
MENNKSKNSFFKNKDNIIILLSIIVAVLLATICVIFLTIASSKKSKNIDGSNLNTSELINMFESDGYSLEITNLDGTIYVSLNNKKDGISIQRIFNTYIGTLMTFDDDSINDEMADILNISDNDTEEKKKQYKAYKNWLEYYNISKMQLIDMLDYYYTNNKENIEYIDTNKLLNNN